MARLSGDTDPSGTTFHRVRTAGSVADTVVDEIEALIAREKLPAGHRIGTKQELAEQFGIAPATLGEALRVLRARGVIDARPGPGGGVFVANQSPLLRLAHSVLKLRERGAPVNEVIEVLDALDEAVVRDAAELRTEQDMAELDALMAELSDVWHDPIEGLHCNWKLHRRIAEISTNAVLRSFYQNLVDYIEGESLAPDDPQGALAVPGFRQDTDERLQAHYDLVEAIRSGDQELVRAAVVRHRTLGRS
jgi:DNA-binding FadR family transcriptional regulator